MAVQTTLGSCPQCTAAPDQAQITLGNAARVWTRTVACPRFCTTLLPWPGAMVESRKTTYPLDIGTLITYAVVFIANRIQNAPKQGRGWVFPMP